MNDITTANHQAQLLAQQGLTPIQYSARLSEFLASGNMTEAEVDRYSRAYNTQYEVQHRSAAITSAAADLPRTAPGQRVQRDHGFITVLLLALIVFAAFFYTWPRFHDFVVTTWHELRHDVRTQIE